MPTVVMCAAFDAATDARIEALRGVVESAGLPVHRSHRPHLTLNAAPVDDPARVVAVAQAIADRHAPMQSSAFRLGSFPSGVLYVDLPITPALAELQLDVHHEMGERWAHAFGEHTEPGHWVAHCTLATKVPPPALRRLVTEPVEPFTATIDALAVIIVGGTGDVAHVPLGRTPST